MTSAFIPELSYVPPERKRSHSSATLCLLIPVSHCMYLIQYYLKYLSFMAIKSANSSNFNNNLVLFEIWC